MSHKQCYEKREVLVKEIESLRATLVEKGNHISSLAEYLLAMEKEAHGLRENVAALEASEKAWSINAQGNLAERRAAERENQALRESDKARCPDCGKEKSQ